MASENQKFLDALNEFDTIVAGIAEDYKDCTPEQIEEKRQRMIEMTEATLEPISKIFTGLQMMVQNIKKGGQDAEESNELLKAHPEWVEFARLAKIYAELFPYFDAELEENPEAKDSPADLLFLAAARRARADGKEIPVFKWEEKYLAHITAKKTDTLHYPLDKPNGNIWNLLETSTPDGQLTFEIPTAGKDNNKNAYVLYSINFDALDDVTCKSIKRLTSFDKRCYIAAAALYKAGNEVFSATQVYKIMGNRGQPNSDDIKKINDSLLKMQAAQISIDNAAESSVYRYVHFNYHGSLLPLEQVDVIINNTFCDGAIHLFREPPLIDFARGRKQITAIRQQLLESPISKTEANLRLEDYLIEQIGHIKNKAISNKMNYSKIYEKCGITTRNQRARAPEKIKKYLNHYISCEWIKGYKAQADGIVIEI